MNERVVNRWVVAAAGVLMQLALGAVYAWSVFRKPLSKEFHASVSEVNLAFTLTIVFLGVSAYFGGRWMERVGPRRVAFAAAGFYGAGVILSSFTQSSITLLYVTYGVIAGIGLGLGYIVPIATLIKWFPDKRGMITGIAVAGFGGGAVLTAPVAESLIASTKSPFRTFAILGVAYIIMVSIAALIIRNPPEDWRPAGYDPDQATERQERSAHDFEFGEALRTWQWFVLWGLLFLNVSAGIAVISEAAPMAQQIAKASAGAAAGLVSIIAVFNGLGRFVWGWLSDFIGRRWAFLAMYAIQVVLFALLANATSYGLFLALACGILLCYGGGFGTMPAFAADYFGAKNVGRIYGCMLTAWSAGGVLGPILISTVRDTTGQYTTALYAIAGILLVGSILPFLVRPPAVGERAGRGQAGAPEPAAGR